MLSDARTVACVGAGEIGSSWAIVFARAGLDVHLFDPDPAQRLEAKRRISRAAALLEQLAGVDAAALCARVRIVESAAEALAGAAYVQESAPERLDLKRSVLEELDGLAAPEVGIASSTSAIPIGSIAGRARRPQRCIVVHPLNPPHLIPLVEVAPGPMTSEAVTEDVIAFMRRVGQAPILCRKEIYGFVANRLQMALLREALALHRDGVATTADIDACVTEGLGRRWALLGPFGVEHTNAASIGDDLRKFGEPIREIFSALYQGSDLLSEREIDAISAEVEETFAGRSHEELTDWRDRRLLDAGAAGGSAATAPGPLLFEHVGVAVTDLDRSIDFYASVFGFSLLRRTTVNAYLHLGEDLLELMHSESPRAQACPGTEAGWREEMFRHVGLNHIGFRVDDLDAAIEQIERRGGRLVVQPFEFRPEIEHVEERASPKLRRAARPRGRDSWRVAVFADPDGTMLELLER